MIAAGRGIGYERGSAMNATQTKSVTSTEQATGWIDIYEQFLSLERQLNALRQTLLVMRPPGEDAQISRRPVALGGIWANTELTEDDFVLAERSMFAYDAHLEQES